MGAHLYDDYLRHFPPLPNHPHRNHSHKRYGNNNDDNNNYGLGCHIDDLNDTLLELIFTRLVQWRHLLTCKCVCKRWNSIISNPYFVRYLTHKYSAFTLILIDGWTDDDCLISEHPYFQRHKLDLKNIFNFDIVAYHNDILVSRDGRNSGGFSYKIWNPLTKQFIVVPVTPDDEPEPDHCKAGIAGVVNGVSTINVPNNFVIGFRIILIDTRCYGKRLTCQIYSSVTGKWKTFIVNDLVCEFEFDPFNQAVTWNNRVHWRGRSNKILVIDPFVDDDDIVSYCVLNLPSDFYYDSVLGLSSCQNRLSIAQLESNKDTPRIKVWEFDDDLINWGGTTTAKLRLVINFALLKPRLFDRIFSPIEVLSSSCLSLKNEVICYHPNDPDIVYILYRGKLVECDVGNERLRVIRHCTISWSLRFSLQPKFCCRIILHLFQNQQRLKYQTT